MLADRYAFQSGESWWLDDFVSVDSLRARQLNCDSWNDWPHDLPIAPKALEKAREELAVTQSSGVAVRLLRTQPCDAILVRPSGLW